ncbi:MAG TPA: tetratricopeptide repeat protein, partial [Thermoanaerobaculia bacterium]|nr:tetratricopeptide repeat protein [Thermoanaerobaculia bacterium]
VAVLPFANLSGNADLDHLARGIPAGLITRLAQVAGLEVLSRSETWGTAGKKLSPAALAKSLGVASLVEGELHGGENKLRVDVRLTDATSGVVLWSQGFSGSASDVFALQRQIAVRLTHVLAVPLSPAERRRMAKDPTTSLAAYSYDLRGEQALADATDEQGAELAASQFREALRRDPQFALAHAGLAEALVRVHQYRPEAALLEAADSHVHRALTLDPSLGPAQVALARVARAQGHPESAIKELKTVVSSLAQPDEAYRELAAAYGQMGDLEQAEAALRLAVSSASDYWLNWEKLGALLMRKGSYGEARKALERAAALAPEGINWPELNLATLELIQGHAKASLDAYQKAGALTGVTRDQRVASNVGTAYFYLGEFEKAERFYRRAIELNPNDFTFHRNLGDVLLRLSKRAAATEQYAAALDLVEKRLEQTPGDQSLLLAEAILAAKTDRCSESLATAAALEAKHPAVGEDARQLAEAYALCGKSDQALVAIKSALASGVEPESLAAEPEFESLRADPRFKKLVGRGKSSGSAPKAK